MRRLLAILATLALAQCASSDDDRFRVGESPRAFVIIGVAEAFSSTEADYEMLWRRVDASGNFEDPEGRTAFEARTNDRNTVRVRNIPGEFRLVEIDPGVYALDSVFAVIHDRVNYIANGVVIGPDRPTFEVRPGEAIYLGIWQLDLEDNNAVARPWRLDEADARAVVTQAHPVAGGLRVRETQTRAVLCTPRRLNNVSQRQVC